MKVYNGHGKYKTESHEFFQIYRRQLNFAMSSATGALSIFWQHLNHANLHVRSVHRYHVF